MAINENLQNAVNDLKDAKTTIASALSNIDGIDANSGLGTIAEQMYGKTSIYDTSNAASGNESKVLDGITFYDQLGSQTGTMTNHGAVATNVGIGGSYTIPAGYHNGSGKVTGPSLNLGSSTVASASQILSGYAAFDTSGAKITGTMPEINPTSNDMDIQVSNKANIFAVYQPLTPGYYPQVLDENGNPVSEYGAPVFKSIPATELETNLIAENIKSGVSIFGVEGILSSGYQVIVGASTPMSSALIIPLGEITKIHGIAFEISSVSAMSIGTQKIILSGIYVEDAGYAVSSAFSSTGTAGQVGSIALNPPYISNNSAYISSANTNFSSAFKTSTDYYYVLWGE